jgi:hypothetical protein
MNYLEALAAEFYEFTGHFVRSNVRTRLRKQGGYDVEMDVLAYLPKDKALIHIETSGAATTWARERETLIKKKFGIKNDEYEKELGCEISSIHKMMVIGWAKTIDPFDDGGIEIVPIPAFMRKIANELRQMNPMKKVIPEQYPLLRSIQMALHYGK